MRRSFSDEVWGLQDWPSEGLATAAPGVGQAEMKKDFRKKKASRCLERHQSRQQSRKMQLIYERPGQQPAEICVHAAGE